MTSLIRKINVATCVANRRNASRNFLSSGMSVLFSPSSFFPFSYLKRYELRDSYANREQKEKSNDLPSFASHKKYLKMGRYVHAVLIKNYYDYNNACEIVTQAAPASNCQIILRFLSSNYIYSFINSWYISSMIPRDLEIIVKQGLSSFINFNAIEINYIYYKNYFNRESKSSG